MKLHELTKLTHRTTRVGRGIAAGQGKTAGRGTKGQKARTGHRNAPVGFEGGQTRLYRRLPKVGGFRSLRAHPVTITWTTINRLFADGDRIDLARLNRATVVPTGQAARIVATGTLKRTGLRVSSNVLLTRTAKRQLEASGK